MRKGFTFAELILVMGILALLSSIGVVSLTSVIRSGKVGADTESFLADLHSQQTKAVSGVTREGVSPGGWGIKLAGDRYYLFDGTSYDPLAGDNTEVILESGVTIESDFPDDEIVFLRMSGEIQGHNQEYLSVTVGEPALAKEIRINPYGKLVQ